MSAASAAGPVDRVRVSPAPGLAGPVNVSGTSGCGATAGAGAAVVPPAGYFAAYSWSPRVRLATQSGSRTGVGVRVSVAGVRMMRQLVRGAVTAWARTTTACRPAPPRAHAPVKRT